MATVSDDLTVLETKDGFKYLPPHREAAWLGLLQAHAELTRALDAALHTRHGLSLSAYEVLARLAHAEQSTLRMSQLAERTQLSLSRVSRVVDHLQDRGLVERKSCATDSRVVYAAITPAGKSQIAEAQETFFEVIEERFLGKLSCDEVTTLGTIFTRVFTPVEPGACPTASPPRD
jgi:DNA-binding MarR family transcriptional regulator